MLLSLRLNSIPLARALIPQAQTTKIPRDTIYIYEHHIPYIQDSDLKESNSAILSYFQLGFESIESSVLLSLLINYLQAPFFEEIRTKLQLGYIVSV